VAHVNSISVPRTNLAGTGTSATTVVVEGGGATRDARDCGAGATTISIFMGRSIL
jgi:hypothetical protein